MRYFLISYYKKPNGQMDEVVSVSKNLKTRDRQTAADRIVSFYYQHYAATLDRLAKQNGIEFKKQEPEPEVNLN